MFAPSNLEPTCPGNDVYEPWSQSSVQQTNIRSLKLIDCDLVVVRDLFATMQNIQELTLFDSGGLELLQYIDKFKHLKKFVLKKSSYMVSSALNSQINFNSNPDLQLDLCFQNSELHATDLFENLSFCTFKQLDIEIKKLLVPTSAMLSANAIITCHARSESQGSVDVRIGS